MKTPAKKADQLETRVAALKKEIEALIERRIDAEASPGVPRGVIAQMFWARVHGGHCRCAALERIREFEAQYGAL